MAVKMKNITTKIAFWVFLASLLALGISIVLFSTKAVPVEQVDEFTMWASGSPEASYVGGALIGCSVGVLLLAYFGVGVKFA
jgi:hypothetical protein